MSLVFFKNNKSDNRMIEYDQAVVRLGLEKAAAQAELDRVRVETSKVGEKKAILLNEIAEVERKLSKVRREIINVVNAGKEDIAAMSASRREADQAVDEKTKKLVQLEKHFISLQEKVKDQQETFVLTRDRVNGVRMVLDAVNSELSILLEEKAAIEAQTVDLRRLRSKLEESVAALEKLMDYFAKKEQFLNRKQVDLAKYEERVEKMREDAGNKNKMKFV